MHSTKTQDNIIESASQRSLIRDLRRAKLLSCPLSVAVSREDVARQLADLGLLHIEPNNDLGLTWVTVTSLGREVAVNLGLWDRV